MSHSSGSEHITEAPEPSVVALAMTGDDRAFEELVHRRQGGIRRLMHQLSGDGSAADDLAQEAFFRAWQKLGTLRSPGAFGGWLKQIAVNVFLQEIRRTSPLVRDLDPEETHAAPVQGNPQARLDLSGALAKLKPVERLCIVLSYGERMCHGEICGVTDLPLGTVKSHITRGSARLKKLLKDYKGSLP